MIYHERIEDLSIYYFLTNLFLDAPFIKIVDGFPVENLEVPSISIEADTITSLKFEIGNSVRNKYRTWYIDIFAVNKSQRDDAAYRILKALEENIPVYNYNEGFPPQITPSSLGCLIPDEISLENIRVYPEFTEKLYWRSHIVFSTTYSELI